LSIFPALTRDGRAGQRGNAAARAPRAGSLRNVSAAALARALVSAGFREMLARQRWRGPALTGAARAAAPARQRGVFFDD